MTPTIRFIPCSLWSLLVSVLFDVDVVFDVRLSAGQTAVDVILRNSNQVISHLGRETNKYLAL